MQHFCPLMYYENPYVLNCR